MNIIICGAGRVGYTIAKLLSEQNHSLTVIDQSSEDIQKINDGLDVKGIVGKATYPSVLEKASATEADMIIAVTKNDEINMLICQIAFSMFNIQKKIARIRSSDYLHSKFSKLYSKEKKLVFPVCSTIYYLAVSDLEGGRLIVEDDVITPKTNRLVIFPPGKYHTVENFKGNRISLLVNPWNHEITK